MNQFSLLIFGSLLLAGCTRLPGTGAQTTEDGDYTKCVEGSDLFDPPECPDADPQHPVYFPFPYNCRQYYECTNNIARCIHCAPGTIWDQENLICNHESAVNCTIITTVPTTPTTTVRTTTQEPTTEAPTTQEPTTQEPTTESPTTTSTTTTTTEAPTTIEDDPINWICPENYIGLMRHPYDCEYFYNCAPPRRPCLFKCQEGLYFNPEVGWCDFPANVPDCLGGSPPPTSTTPSPAGSSLNYRNVHRSNMAQNIQFIINFLSGKNHADQEDPCEQARRYLDL